nr:immunoglobulin light chain junction region [Macaca mulatta]
TCYCWLYYGASYVF